MYWVILAIYFVAGVTVSIITKINGDYAMISLFVLYAISFVPSASVQMQMRREPPPEVQSTPVRSREAALATTSSGTHHDQPARIATAATTNITPTMAKTRP